MGWSEVSDGLDEQLPPTRQTQMPGATRSRSRSRSARGSQQGQAEVAGECSEFAEDFLSDDNDDHRAAAANVRNLIDKSEVQHPPWPTGIAWWAEPLWNSIQHIRSILPATQTSPNPVGEFLFWSR